METKFLNFITENNLFQRKDRLLVAVSGGIDSMTMLHLLHKTGFNCHVAHCNFQLRQQESDADESFVQERAKTYNFPFHTVRFDTETYALQEGISIQMAARKLRYDWFEELRQNLACSKIVIGHNADDTVETFLINLLRGTGLKGLLGIPVHRETIVRPLLYATRQHIVSYVTQEKLTWREDRSNESDDYLRNKIRHQLIPIIGELTPNNTEGIRQTIHYLTQVNELLKFSLHQLENAFLLPIDKERTDGAIIEIDVFKLLHHSMNALPLVEILQAYGFNGKQCEAIFEKLKLANRASKGTFSGVKFLSNSHWILLNRSVLTVYPQIVLPQNLGFQVLTEPWSMGHSHQVEHPIHLQFTQVKYEQLSRINEANTICLDSDTLAFPLTVRKWMPGDKFQPLGMKKMKKLSDFFVDNKLSIVDKSSVWLLCTGGEICWVIGQRMDDRFKLTNTTTNVLVITFFRKFAT